ncbi:DDB1- and CUL4-associated factor 11 isoform X2 [Agrilus planipennis]|uniref:DDB1- and CUL4-associated factor 11 isoform X2 n=1 Tax=Agrilus planipennis TaxID=224129 RepID=A0A7F5RGZ1_AGRPL|nr:DDB1- and CUL4-associated factor 11 isoform X2 [Agrilus planipennis]
MGSEYSRTRIMDEEDVRSRSGSEDDSDQEIDYAAILQSLISSGSVHIIPSNYDDVEQYPPLPKLKHVPNTTILDASEFSSSVRQACGLGISRIKFPKTNFTQMLLNREKGMTTYNNFSHPNKCRIANEFLPNVMKTLEAYAGKAFCGTFSKNGNHFITASQDRQIRVYKSDDEYYKLVNNIYARDVGWSIIDVGFSPDQEHFVYSTWSSSLHMCSINGESDKQEQLCLVKTGRRFCVFSVLFSSDGTEILGGANDGSLYIYDMIRKERTLRICAHDYDVNSVAFADDTSQIIYSGGDDGLIKVWDRRTLNEENPTPVGTLAGHMDGITFIDSKGDSRHLISNSKDQSIKLWDVRVFSDPRAADNTLRAVHDQTWDYRWQEVPKKLYSNKNKIEGDTSIMTYKGHIVIKTLVRCRFSPMSTTGQRYIYTGCGGGRVVVYDALTGKIKRDLSGHNACVRDVSWHPYRNEILSSSWDGMVGLWTYKGSVPYIEAEDSEDSFSSSSRHSERPLRRSLRLAIKKHVQGKVQPEQ